MKGSRANNELIFLNEKISKLLHHPLKRNIFICKDLRGQYKTVDSFLSNKIIQFIHPNHKFKSFFIQMQN